MRLLRLIHVATAIGAAALVGCQGPPADAGPQPGVVTAAAPTNAQPTGPAAPGPADPTSPSELAAELRAEHDPIAAHRARRFYLQGVKLLNDPLRVDEAVREFQLALEADTLFYKAHFKLGICYYQKGQYDLEITEYRKCLAVNPDYVPAQLNLGHAFLARDMLEEARDSYQKVIERDPHNGVALFNLGLVEFDLRRFDRSYDYLDRFLKVHKESGQMGERAKMYLEEIRLRREGDQQGG